MLGSEADLAGSCSYYVTHEFKDTPTTVLQLVGGLFNFVSGTNVLGTSLSQTDQDPILLQSMNAGSFVGGRLGERLFVPFTSATLRHPRHTLTTVLTSLVPSRSGYKVYTDC